MKGEFYLGLWDGDTPPQWPDDYISNDELCGAFGFTIKSKTLPPPNKKEQERIQKVLDADPFILTTLSFSLDQISGPGPAAIRMMQGVAEDESEDDDDS